jgi:hypothetical protein
VKGDVGELGAEPPVTAFAWKSMELIAAKGVKPTAAEVLSGPGVHAAIGFILPSLSLTMSRAGNDNSTH